MAKAVRDDIDFDDSYDWLELPSIPEKCFNPLNEHPLMQRTKDPLQNIVELMSSTEYLHFATKSLLNIDLLPFQLVILEVLWTKKLPLLIGCRGLSKSFLLATYALLRLVFHPGCKIVIVGAGFRQAKQLFDYMVTIWEKAPVLKDIAGKGGGPKVEIDRCKFVIGKSVCVACPLGDGSKIRGLRANYILADEKASISEEIFNLVVQGFGVVSPNPVDKVKEAAMIRKLKSLGAWSDELEMMRRNSLGGNQIVASGTAFFSFNHFCGQWQRWKAIIESKGDTKKLRSIIGDDNIMQEGFNWRDYAIIRVPYSKLPEGLLDPAILAQAKANLTHSQFMIEYGATFVSDSDGFYKRSIIEAATTHKAINVNGESVQFSAMRDGNPEKTYVIGIDPAADRDNAAIVVLENNITYRKVVHCWTTNRQRYVNYKKYMEKNGVTVDDDYYRYIAKKIRSLMASFNTDCIVMDKHGGGVAIAEALSSKASCEPGEFPIFEVIDPDKPKPYDDAEGLHILRLLAPTNDLNSDANHGMLKDLQDKVLLFPAYDTVEIEKATRMDEINDLTYDTYEDIVDEIEELKKEMTLIVALPSSTLGKESFDTPSLKNDTKRSHYKKDRYSALLYANYYLRNKDRAEIPTIKYIAVGKSSAITQKTGNKSDGSMYYGPGMIKFANSKWNKRANFTSYKHR